MTRMAAQALRSAVAAAGDAPAQGAALGKAAVGGAAAASDVDPPPPDAAPRRQATRMWTEEEDAMLQLRV